MSWSRKMWHIKGKKTSETIKDTRRNYINDSFVLWVCSFERYWRTFITSLTEGTFESCCFFSVFSLDEMSLSLAPSLVYLSLWWFSLISPAFWHLATRVHFKGVTLMRNAVPTFKKCPVLWNYVLIWYHLHVGSSLEEAIFIKRRVLWTKKRPKDAPYFLFPFYHSHLKSF